VKGNTVVAVEQAVCTGAHNLRALTRVSLCPIPQWAAMEGCLAVALMAEHDDAEQASGQCARACWRADACAQGVPVACTACVHYASSSGRGQSKEQRAWTA